MGINSGEINYLLKIPDETEATNSGLHWNRREKYVWFCTLLLGTTAIYACRTTMPLVAPSASKDLKWSKTEVGTVLSSFFWGYALTQIIGGYLSDKFGAEKVMLAAGVGWGFVTFWFHQLVYLFSDHDTAFKFILFARVFLGACQGVHFPAMASLSSRNLNSKDRSLFFSFSTAGTALGSLLTGTVGSYVNEAFGWPFVFYSIGFLSLTWVGVLKYYALEMHRQRKNVLGMSSTAPLLGNVAAAQAAAVNDSIVPWLTYIKSPALWACMICHFCQNNCFFLLLSWLPTYFHDNFPDAKSWIFNIVPWCLMIPGILTSGYLSQRLHSKGYSVGTTRKIIESICMGTELICLILIGFCKSFEFALLFVTICLWASGFHNGACLVNPQDIAPKHSGSIFGVMNAAGSLPGYTSSFTLAITFTTIAMFAKSFHNFGSGVNPLDIAPRHSGFVHGIVNSAGSIAGFIGVYIAGYILELTGSWSAVFNVTAFINFVGLTTFIVFGSGNPIV